MLVIVLMLKMVVVFMVVIVVWLKAVTFGVYLIEGRF